jgi:ribosomal protein S18 acetylase RimI-like enzyme
MTHLSTGESEMALSTPRPVPGLTIERAGPDDAGWVADLIGAAFQPLAVAQWLVPDPQQRARVLPANFRIFVEHALAHGEVHVTADHAAVAVWFPQDGQPVPPPDRYDERLQAACGESTPRFQVLDSLFEQHHPTTPHHHLAFLAVHPDQQRRGLGSALMAYHHARLDQLQIAAYLEASSEENRNLYQRHGYQTMGETFRLPDSTPMWPMWRPPRPTGAVRADGSGG